MGTLVGHVAPGFGFLLIGLWHLYNNSKLHSLRPSSYNSLPWFPSPVVRRLELLIIIFASTASIAMELFIGPHNHQPLDPVDLTIPSYHLHNFEHASISLSFLVFAAFAFALDRLAPPRPTALGFTQLLAAVAFAQQLLMFHLHSSDHMGVEGQYHSLLQLVILVSLTTTLLSIGLPRSFYVSFVRSVSIAFQGVWFIFMGFMLWTPALMFKGCFMNLEEGHQVVRCNGENSLHRAKSLVNLQFSWFLTWVVVLSVVVCFWIAKLYPEEREYVAIGKDVASASASASDDDDDLEAQKTGLEETRSFIHIGKGMRAINLER